MNVIIQFEFGPDILLDTDFLKEVLDKISNNEFVDGLQVTINEEVH